MNCKIFAALVVVACAVAVQGKTDFKKPSKQLNSADVEALLNPTVQSLPQGQHKLVYKGAGGQEQCVVCQPFQGCGCRDVVAIRCELKRLKQKLLRLKRIAAPHQRSHHGREEPEQVKKPKIQPVVKPAVLPLIKKAVKPLVKPLIKPAVEPTVKLAVEPAVVKPAVLVDPKPLVKVAVVKPAVEEKKVVLV